MSDVKYTANVKVERLRGPMRKAWLPARDEHITFGVHSDIAEHYNVAPDDFPPDATTLDYVIAAAAG
ncbi:MAG: hypothetical protein HKN07_07005 [Acidimicrobiia bacterium]|nr:hypothetical protein [Acidimicrobiia bacterium]NNF63993.1 hypothetical protein [Acidimicrobiia bacterium]